MEDWEQFFAEKSRRRSEKDRLERRRQHTERIIYAAIIGSIIAGGIAGLAILR